MWEDLFGGGGDIFSGGDFLNAGPTFADVPAPSDFWTSANAVPAPDFSSVPSPSDFWSPGGAADFWGGGGAADIFGAAGGAAGGGAPDLTAMLGQGGAAGGGMAPSLPAAPAALPQQGVIPQMGAPAQGGGVTIGGAPAGGGDLSAIEPAAQTPPALPVAEQGGFEKILDKLGIWGPQGLGKNALPAASMLATLYKQATTPNVFKQMGGTGATALKQLGEKPLGVSNQLLDQYMQGKVMPAQAYDIQQWAIQAKARLQDQFARMGLGSSSQLQQALNDIDAKAAAMMDQARQNVLQSGLSAAGVGQGPTRDAVIAQMQMDQQASAAQQGFLAALAKMQTGQNPVADPRM